MLGNRCFSVRLSGVFPSSDIDRARVVFATQGKDAATLAAFADDLTAHGGDPDAVAEVYNDMSPAFIKGTAGSLPNAAITFDKFHAVKIINDAVAPAVVQTGVVNTLD